MSKGQLGGEEKGQPSKKEHLDASHLGMIVGSPFKKYVFGVMHIRSLHVERSNWREKMKCRLGLFGKVHSWISY